MAQPTDPRAHREALQRVQVGVIGLGLVLLVVALTNLVVSVRSNPQSAPGTVAAPGAVDGAANGTAPQTEPFADLGVTPKADPTPTGPMAPAVPDLEPDPRLTKPMDQDPKKRAQSGR